MAGENAAPGQVLVNAANTAGKLDTARVLGVPARLLIPLGNVFGLWRIPVAAMGVGRRQRPQKPEKPRNLFRGPGLLLFNWATLIGDN